MASYTLNEIKVAAYNLTELPDLTPRQRSLWEGLAYCYEWHRLHPNEQTEACKALAQHYIDLFWGDDI